MAKSTYADMTLDQLIAAKGEIEQLIADKVDGERRELMAKLAALDGITGVKRAPSATRSRQSPKALYRLPDGTEWSGRGSIPRAFKDAGVVTKADLDAFKI